MGPAHGVAARRHRARGRPPGRRVQRRPGDRRGGRRRARRAIPASRASRSPARSTPGGWSRRRPRANLTPVSLELGGKSPFVIFADADPDAALAQAVNQFDNAGQVCLAGTRLLVERSDLRRLRRAVHGRRRRDRQGDPREETTDIGPLITARAPRAGRRVRPARESGAVRVSSSAVGSQRGARRPVLPADALRRRTRRAPRSSRRRSSGRSSRHSRSPTRTRRSRSRTRPTSAWPRPSTPRTTAVPSGSPSGSSPGPCGSTASSSAT